MNYYQISGSVSNKQLSISSGTRDPFNLAFLEHRSAGFGNHSTEGIVLRWIRSFAGLFRRSNCVGGRPSNTWHRDYSKDTKRDLRSHGSAITSLRIQDTRILIEGLLFPMILFYISSRQSSTSFCKFDFSNAVFPKSKRTAL